FPKALPVEATATLRNQIGQVVTQRQLKPGDVTTEWNVSGLPSGLYFLEVRQEGLPPRVLQVVKDH
ncbi:MAG: T9SS type A sorting domain-containing protein, partial [Bacteroidetes bacterium]|nr:T9SS type A sorting domain-containing protein [Bacteroidota bacterium]